MDQSSPGPGIYNDGGIRNSTHLHLQWAQRPYVLTQLYEDTNHVPLPKDKHLSVLPQGKAESPCGQISQLEGLPAFICQTASHLSSGFEWGQPVSHHQPARTTVWWL